MSTHPRNRYEPSTTTKEINPMTLRARLRADQGDCAVAGHVAALVLLSLVAVLFMAGSAAAAGGPRWEVTSIAKPTNFSPLDFSGRDEYEIIVTNVGAASTDGTPVTITDTLPAKLTAKKVEFVRYGYPTFEGVSELGPTNCTLAPTVQCTYPGTSGEAPALPHGEELLMTVRVEVHTSKAGPLTNHVTVSGGGAPEASVTSTNEVTAGGLPAPFGVEQAGISDLGKDGSPSIQAGAHPFELTTMIAFNNEAGTNLLAGGDGYPRYPTADPRNIVTELPAGFVGNPRAVPQCKIAQFADNKCPLDSQVGTAVVKVNETERLLRQAYNVTPQLGNVAVIGLEGEFGPKVLLTPTVRTGGDYGLRVTAINTPRLWVEYIKVTIWGVPADPSHDFWRGRDCGNVGCKKGSGGVPSGAQPPIPFLTNPTSCSGEPLSASVFSNSWEDFDALASDATTWPAVVGCNQLAFEPTIEARPTTNLADSPSGLAVDLKVPQPQDPEGLAEAHLKDASVTLPPGLLVNPASASGLAGCTEAQFGLHGEGAANCPDAAKLGKVEVQTPLLEKPLEGAVFLAQPNENPFHSLLALYISVNDPATGVVIKLPGKVTPDAQTGQLTASFEENPQLPFEDFKLRFFGGAQGPLRTPATCGSYTSTAELTPWSAPESGPPAIPDDSFAIVSSPGGSGACAHAAAEEPNAPVFHAGTENPQAGVYSPFSLKLIREDGSQVISGINTTLPPGLVGRLAGVEECSDAQLAAAALKDGNSERSAPSCPLNSEVGVVNVGTGAGPDPYYVQGHAYLSGPYKGAPLSLAIITPAVAGPFDLGTVVVRTALFVDPFTTQIRAVSDPIPTILQGIPLDVRSIALKMDRPRFTLNPTDCEELSFAGQAISLLGATAPLTQRFQVGGCAALPFKPRLSLRLKGSPKRSKFPALTATLTMPPGSANVAAAQVTLPHSSFLAQAHIDKTCGRPELASHTCPASSIYGHATAVTPLLDQPLEGPVYLATGFGYELPALVADLNGQIEVLLKGKVDSGRGDGIRNSFEVVPDAPVTKFTLHMFGGRKSLIENSQYLCGKRSKTKALARFTAQNGRVVELEPTVANSCKHKHGKNSKHSKGAHKRLPARLLRLLNSPGW